MSKKMNFISKFCTAIRNGCLLIGLFCSSVFLNAQNLAVSNEVSLQITQIVSYLEYSCNVMGDPDMELIDKEMISNESYLRIFSSPAVQIEDDLTDNRSRPIYKNVQAYLRDIQFFFQKANFEMKITSIDKKTGEDNNLYYLVTLQRKINGVTKNNQPFSNTSTRYIELNPTNSADLKIVSIYTTKLFQVDENIQWWEKLSNNWKKEFSKHIYLSGDLSLAQFTEMKGLFNWKDSYEWIDDKGKKHELKFSKETWSEKIQTLFQLKNLNLSGETFFTNVNPLSKFTELEKVNLENTQVKNLDGLRNAIFLKELSLSNTNIDQLESIARLPNLEKLNVSNTRLISLSGIENFSRLTALSVANTLLSPKELAKLGNVKTIESLNISNLKIENFQFIGQLPKLKNVDISKSDVKNLEFLSNAQSLERLWFENTVVESLKPLEKLPNLQYIFCDGSAVTKTEVKSFNQFQPKCIVIYESALLINWWKTVPEIVKQPFLVNIINPEEPNKEELHQIIRTKKLSLSDRNIDDIAWIRFFTNLEELDLSNNPFQNIDPLIQLKSLTNINLSYTEVQNFSVLGSLDALKEIKLANTSIANLVPFRNLAQLELLDVNYTSVTKEECVRFENQYPQVLLLYKSANLVEWWQSLPTEWKTLLEDRFSMRLPNEMQLHQMVRVADFSIKKNTKIVNIEPLKEFRNVQYLSISETNISDIQVLYYLNQLKSLDLSRNPILDFSIISNLYYLEELNLSSLRLKDISFLAKNTRLKSLNISNTQVKNLKPIANHKTIEMLDISNTSVNNLNALKKLPLKKLICFNSKLKPKQIQNFKQQHPNCEVLFY